MHITKIELPFGKNFAIYGPTVGYYEQSKTLLAKEGFAVIFAWAYSPSPIEIGHINLNLHSSAFSAAIGSRPRESTCSSLSGFTSGFLEKTVSEWWSKYVLVIN